MDGYYLGLLVGLLLGGIGGYLLTVYVRRIRRDLVRLRHEQGRTFRQAMAEQRQANFLRKHQRKLGARREAIAKQRVHRA